jgi:hypothetical protein
MALSTDVNLPRNHKARFPDRCVVCGVRSPNASIEIKAGTFGGWDILSMLLTEPYYVEVPACTRCGRRLRFQRLLDWIQMIVAVVVSIWLVMPLVDERFPHFAGKKWIALGVGILSIMPLVIWRTCFPYSFDMTAFANSVDYEFRDEAAAHEFAELNQDAEWFKTEDLTKPRS